MKVRKLKHARWHRVTERHMTALACWGNMRAFMPFLTPRPWPKPIRAVRVRRRPYEKLRRAIEARTERYIGWSFDMVWYDEVFDITIEPQTDEQKRQGWSPVAHITRIPK